MSYITIKLFKLYFLMKVILKNQIFKYVYNVAHLLSEITSVIFLKQKWFWVLKCDN